MSDPDPDAPAPALQKQAEPVEARQSGNPKGRKPGTRNRSTALAASLLDGQARALVQELIEVALAGDVAALRVCVERLLPRPRELPLAFDMPRVEEATDLPAAVAKVAELAASGQLTLGEAERVVAILHRWRSAAGNLLEEPNALGILFRWHQLGDPRQAEYFLRHVTDQDEGLAAFFRVFRPGFALEGFETFFPDFAALEGRIAAHPGGADALHGRLRGYLAALAVKRARGVDGETDGVSADE